MAYDFRYAEAKPLNHFDKICPPAKKSLADIQSDAHAKDLTYFPRFCYRD
ncbi:hypothetical protein [Paenibacillus thiaminolyticus]|nr:hypothetical protein [Paenibacillus thiaminolyticus]